MRDTVIDLAWMLVAFCFVAALVWVLGVRW